VTECGTGLEFVPDKDVTLKGTEVWDILPFNFIFFQVGQALPGTSTQKTRNALDAANLQKN
jgi:hypothetical protein